MKKLLPMIERAVGRLLLVLLPLSLAIPSASADASGNKAVAAKQKTVIRFVYFPTAVPVAVLGETLKRDRVLQKALERAGCRIEFRTLAKGPDALPLIRNRQIDAVMFADMPAIEAASYDGMLIAGIVKRSYASVVTRSGTVLEQLRRKKVANVFGSTSHYALLQALTSVRLSENDVDLVPMGLPQMPEALALGKVDAFAAWEPTPTAAIKRYPGQFSVIYRQVSLSFFALSPRLLLENREAADALSAALIRSVRWLKKGSNLTTASNWALTGMADFSGKASGLGVADIAAITRSDLLDVPAAPLISAAEKETGSTLMREFDFLKNAGMIPADSPREQFRSGIRPDLLARLLARHALFQLSTFDYAP